MAAPVWLLLLAASLAGAVTPVPALSEERHTYIVHTDSSHGFSSASVLQSVAEGAEVLYEYRTVLRGFAAQLTEAEAAALALMESVVLVDKEERYDLHTTRSPEFLGIGDEVPEFLGIGDEVPQPGNNSAGDLIIGLLDTGVWPESRSFDDTGFGPVPPSWKGACEQGQDFNSSACNRKLVGAKFFLKGYEAAKGPLDPTKESRSPRDTDGHGTHTSSTAAGGKVAGANMLGYATGTARGMAVGARVAMYKCCWLGGCFGSDIFAAMEEAIDDGVHVLSLSIGANPDPYYDDPIAVGSFAAMAKGIFVACSAGNAGPGALTATNIAPWITTVAASTIDRDFPVSVVLGNGKMYHGVSLYAGEQLPAGLLLSIVYAGNVSNNATTGHLCMPGTLLADKVAGKIVLCDRGTNARVEKGLVVKVAGGAGMVLANTAASGEELTADAHMLPAAAVGQKAGDAIRNYVLTDSLPMATMVFGGTVVGIQPSPVMAAFSSRGPNNITVEILKPDITAPGVNILAAWTGSNSPSELTVDTRRVEFNIISGTSMSCPHISGLATNLKQAHPDWSPAAIRSALMTTAYVEYSDGSSIIDIATGGAATPFAYGAGHVNPRRAASPGLVYDLSVDDYLDFMCTLKYTSQQLAVVTGRKDFSCDPAKNYSVTNLNYPSFSVVIAIADEAGVVKHSRTLTNVGSPGTYKANVTMISGAAVDVTVEPSQLSFAMAGEKRSYTVSFAAQPLPKGAAAFGRLVWSNGQVTVASPIAVTWT